MKHNISYIVISHKYKFVFVHIPKNGGCSIIDALLPFCDEDVFKYGHAFQSQYYNKFPEVQDYYQFAISRNPFDRVVSAYHYLKCGGMVEDDLRVMHELNLNEISFYEFALRLKDLDISKRYQHLMPQLRWLDHDLTNIDVFSLEEIESSFSIICEKIGINKPLLKKLNTSNHDDYKKYYNHTSYNIVYKKYFDDIARLGYEKFSKKRIRSS